MTKARNAKIQIVGYYGWGNFGDELFVDTVREHQAELWPGSTVKTFVPSRVGGHSKRSVAGSANRAIRALGGALWADTFALCGGSVLSELRGVMQVRERHFGSRSFEGLGVSIGPFNSRSDRARLLKFLSGFDRLIVRDHRSADRYGGDVEVGGDLAALSSRMHRVDPNGSVTVAPSAAAKVAPAQFVSQVRIALQAVGVTKTTAVNLLALNMHPESGDEELCRLLADGINDLGFPIRQYSYGDIGLQGVIDVISASSVVWAQRLHAGIVSYLCGVPFLLVGHHAKCHDFARDIGLDPGLILASDGSWVSGANMSVEAGRSSPVWSVDPSRYISNARRTYGIEDEGGIE